MENPYKVSKRAADTLGLIGEACLQFRLRHDGTVTPFNRRWRTVGGSVGWHADLMLNVNRFLDAGLIDYVRPAGTDVDRFDPGRQVCSWSPVFLTRAGEHLLRRWIHEPFAVVELDELPDRISQAATALSAAYVESSGLLKDASDRYALDLHPHAEKAAEALLDVQNIGGRWHH